MSPRRASLGALRLPRAKQTAPHALYEPPPEFQSPWSSIHCTSQAGRAPASSVLVVIWRVVFLDVNVALVDVLPPEAVQGPLALGVDEPEPPAVLAGPSDGMRGAGRGVADTINIEPPSGGTVAVRPARRLVARRALRLLRVVLQLQASPLPPATRPGRRRAPCAVAGGSCVASERAEDMVAAAYRPEVRYIRSARGRGERTRPAGQAGRNAVDSTRWLEVAFKSSLQFAVTSERGLVS